MLGLMVRTNERTISALEAIMEKYQVRSPDRNRLPSHWCGNTESFRDELIGQTNLRFLQEHLENLLQVIFTSITNDGVRAFFVRNLKTTLDNTDLILSYLKLKGWIEIGPYYLNTPAGVEARITAAEACHLWDHVTFRYDNIRKTNLYLSITHDLDLKFIIRRGWLNSTNRLYWNRNAKIWNFLPKRPPEVVISPIGNEYMCDDQMYRDILQGLQAAASLHADASKQCIYNDSAAFSTGCCLTK